MNIMEENKLNQDEQSQKLQDLMADSILQNIETSRFDGGVIKITLAEFFAFGILNQKTYINQEMEFIMADMDFMCSTNRLVSITSYNATQIEKRLFNGTNSDLVDVSDFQKQMNILHGIKEEDSEHEK